MVAIRDVFKANSTDLKDLRADPSTVIKVQGLVQEMLEANENRQMGIAEELLKEYGAFALPGVISATYVFQDKLGNQKRKQRMAELMAQLSADSRAAHRLILDAGIVECPFEVSREIAALAIEKIGDVEIIREEQTRLLTELNDLVRIEERDSVLALFQVLTNAGLGYERGLEVCRNWFSGDYEAKTPSKLMKFLLVCFPDKTGQTLDVLLGSLDRQDKEAGQIIKDTVDLAGPEAVLPAMQAASRRIQRERVSRAKPVEYLFEGAISRQVMACPDWIPTWEAAVLKEYSGEGISRYWWQAVAEAIKHGSQEARSYVERTTKVGQNEEFTLWAIIQLMFLEKAQRSGGDTRQWAKQLLNDLRQTNPSLVDDAEDRHEQIIGGSPSSFTKYRKDPNVPGIR